MKASNLHRAGHLLKTLDNLTDILETLHNREAKLRIEARDSTSVRSNDYETSRMNKEKKKGDEEDGLGYLRESLGDAAIRIKQELESMGLEFDEIPDILQQYQESILREGEK